MTAPHATASNNTALPAAVGSVFTAPGGAVPGALMAAEIQEQPESLARLLEHGRPDIARLAAILRDTDIRYVLLAARGTSDHAALYAKYLIETVLGLPAGLASPSSLTVYGAEPKMDGVLWLAVSQSGGSPDLVDSTAAAARGGALTVAVTNAPSSPLAAASRHHLDILAGPERAVAGRGQRAAAVADVQLLRLLAAPVGVLVAVDVLLHQPGRDPQHPRRHRPALGLVAVEEPGPGVSSQHVGELPGQVVSVGDPGVRAVAAGRRNDVRGVTREQHPPLHKAFGDLLRHVPGEAGADRHRHIGRADGRAHQLGAAGIGEVVQALAVLRAVADDQGAARQRVVVHQDPHDLGVLHMDDAVAPVAEDRAQVRAEGDAHVAGQHTAAVPRHLERLAHGAARPVAGQQPVAAEGVGAVVVREDRGDPVGVLREGEEFRAEPQVRAQCHGALTQQRLQPVLRKQQEPGGSEVAQLVVALQLLLAEQDFAGEGGHPGPGSVRLEAGGLPQGGVLDVHLAQQFGGPRVVPDRSGVDGSAWVLLHEGAADSVVGEEHGGGQADEAAADDEDGERMGGGAGRGVRYTVHVDNLYRAWRVVNRDRFAARHGEMSAISARKSSRAGAARSAKARVGGAGASDTQAKDADATRAKHAGAHPMRTKSTTRATAATTKKAGRICMGLQRKNVRRANRTALSCTTRWPRALFRIPAPHAATRNERAPAAVWHRTWLGFLEPELERMCDDSAETLHDRAADRRHDPHRLSD